MRRLLILITLISACKSEGPRPDPAAAPVRGSEAPNAVHSDRAAPVVDNAAKKATKTPAAPSSTPSATPPSTVVNLGALQFAVPAGWTQRPSNSAMRKAHLVVPGKTGNGYLVVYYFGQNGAGGVEDNISRWVGQFRSKDGSPATMTDRKELQLKKVKVTQVEVAGDYAGSMVGGGAVGDAKPDQRLIAAIVDSAQGPFYFKLLGPDATIDGARDAFDQLLASLR